MSEKIYSVTSVTLTIEKRNPPVLVINAEGVTNTNGWSGGHLEPYVYVHPPLHGIYEFDFLANKPTGIVNPVLTPITAKPYEWENFPAELKGVKVYASTNEVVENL